VKSSARLRDFSVSRLRWLLAALFIALTVPTAALMWQAWSQLKWEAFYQYRGMAEELSARIDTELAEGIAAAEARSFSDFSFLVVSGDPSANLLQRSPLAEYPVYQELPGVIGYFQVDADGVFTTPLLPPAGSEAKLGIPADELVNRRQLAAGIASVLLDNRLVSPGHVRIAESSIQAQGMASESDEEAFTDGNEVDKPMPATIDDAERDTAQMQEAPQGGSETLSRELRRDYDYNQQAFDELNSPSETVAKPASSAAIGEQRQSQERAAQDNYAKLTDLKLDAALEKKSEIAKEKTSTDAASTSVSVSAARSPAANRVRRLEQSALPESLVPVEEGPVSRPAAAESVSAPITTFASEIDPYEFSLLDSGHLVMFRKVWRDGARLIQGLLLDTDTFLLNVIEKEYQATSLSAMSDLIVAYQGNILQTVHGGSARYPVSPDALQGTLLYRGNLSAPFDRLDLLFSVNRLPAGPGASVLLWTSTVIAVVFIAGFVVLYRLGLSQIQLARQQQDFVSAVSHELKTPLTSIRMYGEMLMEGWVSEDKRKQYYTYIHDESERLTRLISNVLQLAKITHNEPKFDLQVKSVAELLDQVESKIGNQVERAGFALTIRRDEMAETSKVSIDEDSFAQIMINLVDNAIKFSKHAEIRSIEISCRHSKPGSTTFSVRDYGPGIARDQMKKIFQLFYRSESELTRETVGTGIGLAIVHQLTLAMNGQVDVVNKDPGAEFRVTFPST
jgi:signal transduction histidine kinase